MQELGGEKGGGAGGRRKVDVRCYVVPVVVGVMFVGVLVMWWTWMLVAVVMCSDVMCYQGGDCTVAATAKAV